MRPIGGGWIDLARGGIDFKDPARTETKKRGAVTAPRHLLAHALRWRRMGGARLIAWRGKPVAEIDTAFRSACRRAEAMAARRGMTFDLSAVSPHTLKHTSVCRFIARGGRLEDAISYFATGARTLETVYRKRSQEHPKGARAVWENAARESMLTGVGTTRNGPISGTAPLPTKTLKILFFLERAMRFELTTPTLARLKST